ncbi:hypothetical protein [Pedobacter sp.]
MHPNRAPEKFDKTKSQKQAIDELKMAISSPFFLGLSKDEESNADL